MNRVAALASCFLAFFPGLGSAALVSATSAAEAADEDGYDLVSLLHLSTQLLQRGGGSLMARTAAEAFTHGAWEDAAAAPSASDASSNPKRSEASAGARTIDNSALETPERPMKAVSSGKRASIKGASNATSAAGGGAESETGQTPMMAIDLSMYTHHPGLMSLYTTPSNPMDLLVDITDLLATQAPVLITAAAARGSYVDGLGQAVTLRNPLENSSNTLYQFNMAPDGMGVDVFQPVTSMRTTDMESLNALNQGAHSPWIGTLQILPCAGVSPDRVIVDGMVLIANGFFVAQTHVAGMSSYRITRAASFALNFDVTIRYVSMQYGDRSITFSMLKLPNVPMEARANDDRLNYFTTSYTDLGMHLDSDNVEDTNSDREVDMIWRYNLTAQPNNQIRIHVDPTVPLRWRQVFKEGVEAWNEAFALIGLPNTVRGVLPTDADWPADYDADDARYSTVSWCIDHTSVFSMGIAKVDPRSGEIMKSDIIMTDGWVRAYLDDLTHLDTSEASTGPAATSRHGFRLEQRSTATAPRGDAASSWRLPRGEVGAEQVDRPLLGLLGEGAEAKQAEKAESSLLDRPPTSLLAANVPREKWQAVIGEALKEIVMHEAGHVLGLRHNFKGSLGVSYECTQNRSCTAEHSMGSSVMDYYPLNVPTEGIDNVHVASPKIGAYDKLVIRYGYSELSGPAPPVVNGVPAELEHILVQAEAYEVCTDGEYSAGQDPLCEQHELSSTPLAWYEAQLDQVRVLQGRLLNTSVAPGEPYWNYGTAVTYAMGLVNRVATRLSYWIGGVNTTLLHRSRTGDAGGRATAPIAEVQQRKALQLLMQTVRPYSCGLLPPQDMQGFLVSHTSLNGVSRLNLDATVRQNQETYMSALLSQQQLQILEEGEPQGGMGVGQYLADIVFTVFADSPSGAGMWQSMPAMPQDWNLQRIVVQSLLSLEISSAISEDIASHAAVTMHALRSRLARAIEAAPQPAEADWAHCSNEGEQCQCAGEVRYGVAESQRWSQQVTTGPVNCTNAVFTDPLPYSRKVCQCFSGGTSTLEQEQRRLLAHLVRLSKEAGNG